MQMSHIPLKVNYESMEKVQVLLWHRMKDLDHATSYKGIMITLFFDLTSAHSPQVGNSKELKNITLPKLDGKNFQYLDS
jgi:hypothetical protein